ncbi:AI-2E family transporter [Brevibacterium samyangense]|uniref:AI-2E family transporter n=1 Tax=Brevibacterium samyangense TaxID=366888 RepID=A0ABN2T5K5_9MICO
MTPSSGDQPTTGDTPVPGGAPDSADSTAEAPRTSGAPLASDAAEASAGAGVSGAAGVTGGPADHAVPGSPGSPGTAGSAPRDVEDGDGRKHGFLTIGSGFWLGFTGVLGGGIAWWLLASVGSISTVISYVGIALFFALGLEPVVAFLVKRGVHRTLAVVCVLIAVVALAVAVGILVLPTLITQIQSFIGQLPTIIAEIATVDWVIDLEMRLGGAVDIDAVFAALGDWVADPANVTSIGGGVVAVGAGIAGFLTGAIVVMILVVYFTATLPAIKSGAYSLVARSRRALVKEVTEEVTRSVGRYVLGQVSLAAINGVLSFVVLSFLGAPLPALLALIAFLGSLIPLVGTLTGSIIIVFSCLMVSPGMALVAGIYYLFYMQVEAYLLSPRIMKAAVNIPGSVVIIAALTGAGLAGVLGAIMAVPFAASVLIVVRRVIVPRQDRR